MAKALCFGFSSSEIPCYINFLNFHRYLWIIFLRTWERKQRRIPSLAHEHSYEFNPIQAKIRVWFRVWFRKKSENIRAKCDMNRLWISTELFLKTSWFSTEILWKLWTGVNKQQKSASQLTEYQSYIKREHCKRLFQFQIKYNVLYVQGCEKTSWYLKSSIQLKHLFLSTFISVLHLNWVLNNLDRAETIYMIISTWPCKFLLFLTSFTDGLFCDFFKKIWSLFSQLRARKQNLFSNKRFEYYICRLKFNAYFYENHSFFSAYENSRCFVYNFIKGYTTRDRTPLPQIQ